MSKKKKKSKKIPDSYDFASLVSGRKIPLLILDEKWLELFEIGRMPSEVKELQNELGKIVAKQGKIIDEIAGLKRYKSNLLQEIVENMGVDESTIGVLRAKKLEKNQRLVNEIKEKITINEEILDELPKEMQKVNEELLIISSNICYEKLHSNSEEIKQLNAEIEELSEMLMMKKLEKQDKEQSINKMYTYMHNMYGAEIMELLDLKNKEF